jgi:hypothetical protein
MAGNGGAAGSMMHVVERRELTSGARRSARGERGGVENGRRNPRRRNAFSRRRHWHAG